MVTFHEWLEQRENESITEASALQQLAAIGGIMASMLFGTAGIHLLQNMPQAELKNVSTPVELATKIADAGKQEGLKPKSDPNSVAVKAVKQAQGGAVGSGATGPTSGNAGGAEDDDTIYFKMNPKYEGKFSPGAKQYVQCDKDGKEVPNGEDYNRATMMMKYGNGPDVKIITTGTSASGVGSMNQQLRGY